MDNQFDSDLHLETIKDLLQFTALQSVKNLN
ncbi:uncharacterized protein METZ01_LOCUS399066 [marine metagenome]|uniref:Uncharacterized protein n=1 Tax=marine metagenome TaxID=408172 RepID=A0A382VI49_9ZZZZ